MLDVCDEFVSLRPHGYAAAGHAIITAGCAAA